MTVTMSDQTIPTFILAAREALNEGQYEAALEHLERAGLEAGSDPYRAGARRLAGCLMLVVGRYAEGLEVLETCRTSLVTPAFPKVRYQKQFPADQPEAQRIAVGLLECLGLGLSVSELTGDGTAFGDPATLRSLRRLAKALTRAGRSADARRVRESIERWSRPA